MKKRSNIFMGFMAALLAAAVLGACSGSEDAN